MGNKTTSQAILQKARARAAETITVRVEAWDTDLVIRRLSTQEATEMIQQFVTAGDDGKLKEDSVGSNKFLFQRTVIEPAFTPEEVDELWATESVDTTGKVLQAIRAFNTLTAEAQKETAHSFPVQE